MGLMLLRLWTTTTRKEIKAMLPENRPPTHPGEMLLEEFLKPMGMTQADLAERIHVSYPRVNEIINGRRGITPDTALRLAKLFGTTPEFWLNGQRNWDLWHAMRSTEAKNLKSIKPVLA
ncbi:HigA family addiction module antitoxin [Gemmatimonadota bacterium]